MKISTELVTLSPKHSLYLRAMAHAMGENDLEKIIEENILRVTAENYLENLALDYKKGSPQRKRAEEAQRLAAKAEEDWCEFVKIAETMPAHRKIKS